MLEKHRASLQNANSERYVIILDNNNIVPVDIHYLLDTGKTKMDTRLKNHSNPYIMDKETALQFRSYVNTDLITEDMYHVNKIEQLTQKGIKYL